MGRENTSADTQYAKSTRLSQGSASTVTIPAPTPDQREYVSDIIKWRDSSYKPDSVIGGPNRRVVD